MKKSEKKRQKEMEAHLYLSAKVEPELRRMMAQILNEMPEDPVRKAVLTN